MLTFERIHGYSHVVQLKSDERIVEKSDIVMSKEVVDDRERGLLFVKATSHPKVFHYGCRQIGDGIYHGDGYVWSSRVGVLNLEFDEDFVEVHIDCRAGLCMHKADLEELLPEGMSLKKVIMFEDKEPYYRPVETQS